MRKILSRLSATMAILAASLVLIQGCSSVPAGRTAERLRIKVAVVYEDPVIPRFDTQRIHSYCTTPGYDYRWNDPRQQMRMFREAIAEVSHGVVEYEIVSEIEAERFFTYMKDDPFRKHITTDGMADLLARPKWGPELERNLGYDYNAMVKHYDFDKMRDAGEIDEVWVYSTPLSGAYESHLMGKGAFWLNSPPAAEPPCTELLTIMFFNYERDLACALESYGHRFESSMMQVYGWWDYDNKKSKEELTPWERYTGYAKIYDRFDAGNSNVGNVHFPPNGVRDYDFTNKDYVMSYADEWLDYPDVPEKKARLINHTEWGDHEGYMRWWLSHMPHFEGINPADGKLNNWWHYVVDYNAALRQEEKLASSK